MVGIALEENRAFSPDPHPQSAPGVTGQAYRVHHPFSGEGACFDGPGDSEGSRGTYPHTDRALGAPGTQIAPRNLPAEAPLHLRKMSPLRKNDPVQEPVCGEPPGLRTGHHAGLTTNTAPGREFTPGPPKSLRNPRKPGHHPEHAHHFKEVPPRGHPPLPGKIYRDN